MLPRFKLLQGDFKCCFHSWPHQPGSLQPASTSCHAGINGPVRDIPRHQPQPGSRSLGWSWAQDRGPGGAGQPGGWGLGGGGIEGHTGWAGLGAGAVVLGSGIEAHTVGRPVGSGFVLGCGIVGTHGGPVQGLGVQALVLGSRVAGTHSGPAWGLGDGPGRWGRGVHRAGRHGGHRAGPGRWGRGVHRAGWHQGHRAGPGRWDLGARGGLALAVGSGCAWRDGPGGRIWVHVAGWPWRRDLGVHGGLALGPRPGLTLMCSCSWASCCRDSCSCCLWNSAMRICLCSCCFCLSARSSCCSCCSRRPGSATGSGNWWSRRRSMGTPGGATGRGRAEATSTVERAQHRGAGDRVARRPGPAPPALPGSPCRHHRDAHAATGDTHATSGDAHAVRATARFRCLLPLPAQQAQKAGLRGLPPSSSERPTPQAEGSRRSDWDAHSNGLSCLCPTPHQGALLAQGTWVQARWPFLTPCLKVDTESKQEKGSDEPWPPEGRGASRVLFSFARSHRRVVCRAHGTVCALKVVQTGALGAQRVSVVTGAPSGRQPVQGSPGSPARLMLQEDHFCALLRNKPPSSHGGVAHEQPRVGSD